MSSNKVYKNEPIRVLQVIGAMDRGGAETMIMNLYRQMNRSRIQFDFLLSSKEEGQYEEEIRGLGGRIFRIDHFNGLNPVSYYRQCTDFFTEHPEFGIVHGHIGSSAALYLKAAKNAGCFTIAHSHNGRPSLSLHSVVYSLYSYPTRRIADQLFGCSTEAGVARYGEKAVKSAKYKNFNNGIDLDQFYFRQDTRNKMRESLDIAENAIVIGTVGRIAEQKNPDKILAIFEKIINAHENCYCLWVGTGPEEERIKKEINNKDLQEKIRLLGVRSDVPQLLNAFDCFLFPSLWEGLPVTIIEAQASGLPIILSDVISREVEITPLLTWMNIAGKEDEWAEKCYEKATNMINTRTKYISLVKCSGYDISETSKDLGDFYLNHVRTR